MSSPPKPIPTPEVDEQGRHDGERAQGDEGGDEGAAEHAQRLGNRKRSGCTHGLGRAIDPPRWGMLVCDGSRLSDIGGEAMEVSYA